ncbi:hypothetical protein ACFORL_02150 [Legionella dresdenensis]|uniref:Substrate of the Dot/Icm secretion system n=1 Tax=Legionella dresdenensis TaxID=450200 RepID=A0ABV8CC45_9GAMM
MPGNSLQAKVYILTKDLYQLTPEFEKNYRYANNCYEIDFTELTKIITEELEKSYLAIKKKKGELPDNKRLNEINHIKAIQKDATENLDVKHEGQISNAKQIIFGSVCYRYMRIFNQYRNPAPYAPSLFQAALRTVNGKPENSELFVIIKELFHIESLDEKGTAVAQSREWGLGIKQHLDMLTFLTCCEAYLNYIKKDPKRYALIAEEKLDDGKDLVEHLENIISRAKVAVEKMPAVQQAKPVLFIKKFYQEMLRREKLIDDAITELKEQFKKKEIPRKEALGKFTRIFPMGGMLAYINTCFPEIINKQNINEELESFKSKMHDAFYYALQGCYFLVWEQKNKALNAILEPLLEINVNNQPDPASRKAAYEVLECVISSLDASQNTIFADCGGRGEFDKAFGVAQGNAIKEWKALQEKPARPTARLQSSMSVF